MADKALLSWSSGKDSAWALHVLRQQSAVDVVGLVTTINTRHRRIAMHAVREELLEQQARSAGLPLRKVPLPWPCSNADYERAMDAELLAARDEGVTALAFGDLFLEDIRQYREQALSRTGLRPLFPLWHLPTDALARTMIASGLRAFLSCVDLKKLPARFAGRAFDLALLEELPHGTDPCGENGEFHTFTWAGPMLSNPVGVAAAEVVERDGFAFADLVPA